MRFLGRRLHSLSCIKFYGRMVERHTASQRKIYDLVDYALGP
jgi:hypothetical protein